MADVYYNGGKTRIWNQYLSGGSAKTLKMVKLAPAYTANIDTDVYLSDISAHRVGTDQTLTSVTVTQNNTNDAADVDVADITESNQTLSFNQVAVYESTGVESTSTLISKHDITEGTLSPTDGTVALTINSRGIASW